MLGVAMVILAQAATAESAIAQYHDMTVAGPRCDGAVRGSDINVCGRRRADRYRVPLIEPDPGDPRNQGVPVERERLLARTSNCEEKSIFLVGCGMTGVSVGTGGIRFAGRERPIAP